MFRILRPDFDAIWENAVVKQRFPRYRGILQNKKVAKYLVVQKTPVSETVSANTSITELWRIHKETRTQFQRFLSDIDNGTMHLEDLPSPDVSFLDLKIQIAYTMLKDCTFCERNCKVDRTAGEIGFCRLDERSVITSAFLHIGEEPPLIPSGTIFFSSCVFKCAFCQNWTISQRWGSTKQLKEGRFVNPSQLRQVMDRLTSEGARNINYVGGDPIPNLHIILHALTLFTENTVQLWNSNMYLTVDAMELLFDVMDFWLPDLKFHDSEFANQMTKAPNYWEVVTRNIKLAYDHGSREMIIRHLVMPNRVKIDSFPILEWCSQNVPLAFVNIMGQYRPEHKVHSDPRYQEINQRVSQQEMETAWDLADQLGIHWREVS